MAMTGQRQQELAAMFNAMRQEQQARENKIAELDNDKHDHSLVIESLEPLAADRKCYRLINGVLVERTVGEVLPVLKANRDNIAVVIKQLSDQYKIKDRELQEFQRKNNIVVAGENPPSSQSSARKASGQGVLA